MNPTENNFTPAEPLCRAAILAIAFGGTCALAQLPMVRVASPRAPHRIVLQLDPAPAAPEAPQAGANTPAPKDDLFAGTEKFAKNATEATEVNMDPDSLDLVGGNEAHKAHRMILNVVRSYEYDKPGMYNMADVEEFRRKLAGADWHCSVHVRDLKTGESTDVCSRRRAPDMIENAIITVAPKELTFIHNIRKANGQGGGLDKEGFGGMALIPPFMPELLPLLSMRIVDPVWMAEMKAQMLASAAVLRAQIPEMINGRFRFQDPTNFNLSKDMKEFEFEMSPEQKQEIDKLTKALKREGQNQDTQELQKGLKDAGAPAQP